MGAEAAIVEPRMVQESDSIVHDYNWKDADDVHEAI